MVLFPRENNLLPSICLKSHYYRCIVQVLKDTQLFEVYEIQIPLGDKLSGFPCLPWEDKRNSQGGKEKKAAEIGVNCTSLGLRQSQVLVSSLVLPIRELEPRSTSSLGKWRDGKGTYHTGLLGGSREATLTRV